MKSFSITSKNQVYLRKDVKRKKASRLLAGSAPEKFAKKDKQFSVIYGFINDTTCSSKRFKNFYYRFGYENFGILLFGFCKWLVKEAENQGIEQMLFIARDGYIIKKAYDLMGFSERIPSGYLELSRRSIKIPASYSVPRSYEDCIKLINATRRISIGQIFDSWGIDIESHLHDLSKAGIEPDAVFWDYELESSAELRKLYELVKGEILSNGLAEKAALEKYLDSFGFDKRTALVDIGYGGTIQKELVKDFERRGKKYDIHGYYMILDMDHISENTDGLPIKARGFTRLTNNKGINVFEYVGLFETMFLEQAGSVKRFYYADGKIIIKRYEYEYDASYGEIDETKNVAMIQRGAIDFIQAAMKSRIGILDTISCANSFYFLERSFLYPTNEIFRHFYNFRFFNMGKTVFLAKPEMGPIGYLLHPKQLITDYFGSMWKTGFVKSLTGCNIPYLQIKKAVKKMLR